MTDGQHLRTIGVPRHATRDFGREAPRARSRPADRWSRGLVAEAIHKFQCDCGYSRLGRKQRNLVSFSRNASLQQALAREVRQFLAGCRASLLGTFLGCQKDVVINIERRSHACIITHHASDVKELDRGHDTRCSRRPCSLESTASPSANRSQRVVSDRHLPRTPVRGFNFQERVAAARRLSSPPRSRPPRRRRTPSSRSGRSA